MKQFVRKVKDNVLLFSEGERLVRDATSNEPWGASSTLMHQIADLTCQREHYESVTNMLWKRLTDVTYPRHVLKACLLVEFLLRNGSERFVHDMKQRKRRFEALSKFTDYAENPEIGADVRAKTLQIITLLDDDAKRNEERVTAARTKGKINGMGNTVNSPIQSSGSQRRDDWSSGRDNGFQESPSTNREPHNHIRQNSDDSFDAKLAKGSKPEPKSKSKEKTKPEKEHQSFGFDDDPLDDDDTPKPKDKPKSSKMDTEDADESTPTSEKKKKKKSKDSENKPKKDKKKKKKETPEDDNEVGAPDPPSGQEDVGDFVGAGGITNQMSNMSFEASFDMMDDSFNQKGQKQPQQSSKKQAQQKQQQQQSASFDFFSSLENQTISPNSASQNEWFDSKPTVKTPEISNNNSNAFFDDFQSASTIPAKISPNQSPAQTAKKPEDIWSSLTNIDSLTAAKPQQPALTKTAPAPLAPQSMGQQPYDVFGMMGANPNQGAYNSNNQAAFNPAPGMYTGYPQQGPPPPQQQMPPYGMPYGQMPQQQGMPPMMQGNPYQQPFVNPQQAGYGAPMMMPMQQQKPQSNLNIPDAFAAFGAMSK